MPLADIEKLKLSKVFSVTRNHRFCSVRNAFMAFRSRTGMSNRRCERRLLLRNCQVPQSLSPPVPYNDASVLNTAS